MWKEKRRFSIAEETITYILSTIFHFSLLFEYFSYYCITPQNQPEVNSQSLTVKTNKQTNKDRSRFLMCYITVLGREVLYLPTDVHMICGNGNGDSTLHLFFPGAFVKITFLLQLSLKAPWEADELLISYWRVGRWLRQRTSSILPWFLLFTHSKNTLSLCLC